MPEFPEAWCIAKLMQLFPDWTDLSVTNKVHQCEFELAKAYVEEGAPGVSEISPLKDELQTVRMLPELRNLLLRLFIVDPKRRLSAAEVLVSRSIGLWWRKLVKAFTWKDMTQIPGSASFW